MSLLLLGFLIGLRHALEADHVAAVAALATRSPNVKSAVQLGVVWGAGHTASLFLIGAAIVVLDAALPVEFAHLLELAVGLMLMLLGLDVVWRICRERIHFHLHRHADGLEHFHGHAHRRHGDSHGPHEHAHLGGFPTRAFLVGIVHGMAGSAALILLTLSTVPTVGMALLYLFLFGLGSILGMAALSVVIAIPLRMSAKGMVWAHNAVQIALGVVTVGIGASLIWAAHPVLTG